MASSARTHTKVCRNKREPASLTDLHMWGIDFRNAPTEVREKVYVDAARARAFQRAFERESCGVASVVLCTCNRTEIYVEVRGGCGAGTALINALEQAGVDGSLLAGSLSTHLVGMDAVRHLYRVASGLESMVLGECEIMGQVRRAYRSAELNNGRLGSLIGRAFQGALRVGKRVRAETRLGAGPVSVAGAAVEDARETLGHLSARHGLLLGAGKTGSLAARHFLKRGIGKLTVINRSFDKARDLVEKTCEAEKHKVRARPYSEMESALAEADVVLTATGSARPIIDRALMERVFENRRGSVLHIYDIAVPRDVDPAAACLPGVRVTGIDQLSGIASRYEAERRKELPDAENIIDEELRELDEWSSTFSIKPAVVELRSYLESLAERELDHVRRREGEEAAETVEKSLRTFIGKLLQQPARRLRTAPSETQRLRDVESLARLFDLRIDPHDDPGIEQ